MELLDMTAENKPAKGDTIILIDSANKIYARTISYVKQPFIAINGELRVVIFAEEYNFSVNCLASDVKILRR